MSKIYQIFTKMSKVFKCSAKDRRILSNSRIVGQAGHSTGLPPGHSFQARPVFFSLLRVSKIVRKPGVHGPMHTSNSEKVLTALPNNYGTDYSQQTIIRVQMKVRNLNHLTAQLQLFASLVKLTMCNKRGLQLKNSFLFYYF